MNISRRSCLGLFALAALPSKALAQSTDPLLSAVIQPTYVRGASRRPSGKGFAIARGQDRLMLTPHHIFGPAGGFDRDYAFAELKGLFDEMQGVSLSGSARIRSARMLDVKGTTPRDWTDRRADLAVFVIENAANVAVLPLARDLPKVGEPVWLLSPVSGLQGLRHAAQITVSSEAIMNWTYAAAGMSLAGTSGAPVVNARGEVVAMNLGVRAEGAARIGLGGSATGIAKRLEAA